MTDTNIPHEYEAEVSVVIHGRTHRFLVGYNLKARGASAVHTTIDDMWEDAEIIHLPRIDIVWLEDCSDDQGMNIYLSLDIETRGKIREALDRWIESNIEADDRTYFTLFDAQNGRELT